MRGRRGDLIDQRAPFRAAQLFRALEFTDRIPHIAHRSPPRNTPNRSVEVTNHECANPSIRAGGFSMKRAITALLMVGCASYQGIYDRDAVRNAALQTVGLEQVAWTSHNASKLPAGMESV